MRYSLGFARTECACEACSVSCRFVPGFLVPDDLANLRDPSMSLFDWAREHLLASG